MVIMRSRKRVLGNIGCGHHQTSGDERKKNFKKSISGERENSKPSTTVGISSKG